MGNRYGTCLGMVMRGRAALLLAAFVVWASACVLVASKGGEGEPCKCEGCGIFSGHFYCDDDLICNMGLAEYTCQRPGSVGAGGACNAWEYVDASAPVLCAEGLTCTYEGRVDAAAGGGVVPCSVSVAWCCEPLPPPPCDDKSGSGLPCPAEDAGVSDSDS